MERPGGDEGDQEHDGDEGVWGAAEYGDGEVSVSGAEVLGGFCESAFSYFTIDLSGSVHIWHSAMYLSFSTAPL